MAYAISKSPLKIQLIRFRLANKSAKPKQPHRRLILAPFPPIKSMKANKTTTGCLLIYAVRKNC